MEEPMMTEEQQDELQNALPKGQCARRIWRDAHPRRRQHFIDDLRSNWSNVSKGLGRPHFLPLVCGRCGGRRRSGSMIG